MAFEDTGEIMRRNYLKSMTEQELKDMVNSLQEGQELHFMNTAWQNRNRNAYQYYMICYGEKFKNNDTYYVHFGLKEKQEKWNGMSQEIG